MEKLFIPPEIFAVFDYREDTYTKKLAWLAQIKKKGGKYTPSRSMVLWSSSLEDTDKTSKIGYAYERFENVPTEGFMINRSIGGVQRSYWSWNPRREKVRIYDPRGFEFEITVDNLLLILEYCTLSHAKGIDGKLVYSFDKSQPVLIPCDSPNYKNCMEHTKVYTDKVYAKDLLVGRRYIMRDSAHSAAIYMGKSVVIGAEDQMSNTQIRALNGNFKEKSVKSQHVFYYIKHKTFEYVNSITTSVSRQESFDADPLYADLRFEHLSINPYATKWTKIQGLQEMSKDDMLECVKENTRRNYYNSYRFLYEDGRQETVLYDTHKEIIERYERTNQSKIHSVWRKISEDVYEHIVFKAEYLKLDKQLEKCFEFENKYIKERSGRSVMEKRRRNYVNPKILEPLRTLPIKMEVYCKKRYRLTDKGKLLVKHDLVQNVNYRTESPKYSYDGKPHIYPISRGMYSRQDTYRRNYETFEEFMSYKYFRNIQLF